MTRLRASIIVLVLALAATLTWSGETGVVVQVVDGDTLKVSLDGRVETVRLIGVDTPETVHPQKPVEYFGKEASAFTRRAAHSQVVRLEDDPQGTNRDRYGRLLRYVFLEDGRLLNAEIIAQGFGHAYTRFPFMRMEEFRGLERQAREAGRGLWKGTEEPAAAPVTPGASTRAPPEAGATETVYVTRTGAKYHRAGCRHLSKSAIPIALKDAAGRYGPCSVCVPPSLPSAGGAPAPPAGPAAGSTPAGQAAPAGDDGAAQVVYVTRTGTKYHRDGCRSLGSSKLPMPLRDAALRYAPCAVCRPSIPTGSAVTGPPANAAAAAPTLVAAARCEAITKQGTRCKRTASAGSRYCWQHKR